MDDRARALLAALDIETYTADEEASGAHVDIVDAAASLREDLRVLRLGRERELTAPDGTRAWRRTLFGEGLEVGDVVIAVNTTETPIDVGLVGTRLISSVIAAADRFTGVLLPHEAVVVRDQTS